MSVSGEGSGKQALLAQSLDARLHGRQSRGQVVCIGLKLST